MRAADRGSERGEREREGMSVAQVLHSLVTAAQVTRLQKSMLEGQLSISRMPPPAIQIPAGPGAYADCRRCPSTRPSAHGEKAGLGWVKFARQQLLFPRAPRSAMKRLPGARAGSHVYLNVSGSSCLIPHCCVLPRFSRLPANCSSLPWRRILVRHPVWISPSARRMHDACIPPGITVDDPFKILPYAARNLCSTRSPGNIAVMHHLLRRASFPRKARSSQCQCPLLRSPHASKTTLSAQRQLYARPPSAHWPLMLLSQNKGQTTCPELPIRQNPGRRVT